MAKQTRRTTGQPRRRHFIKEWRAYRGLSQEQLAERIERTRGLIGQIEAQTTHYTEETLNAIAYALSCEPWDLLNRDPSKEGQVIDIVDLLKDATPEQRAQAIGYIQGLVRRQN